MKVLCTGDLHIGRRPSRLPTHVDSRPHSCARQWDAIVDHALAQRVDVVALSGDVVDQANKYFEAMGPLERGLRRLAEAGIVTVAVAGNHDHDVLPQLARVLSADTFRLLGLGGEWERTTITGRDGARLHVDGWSFPAEHVRDDPLASYALRRDGDVPILGLLHADLDAPASTYAPVSLARLRACPVSLWLLGHVHAPALHQSAGSPPVLYPGSPQPMDPGEPGVHGVWMVELKPGIPPQPRQLPLATVRYASLEIDVAGARDATELRTTVHQALRGGAVELVRDGGPLKHLVLRLRVVGSTPIHRHVERELAAITRDFEGEVDGVALQVDECTTATRPARDLEALARGSDAAAVLARLVLDLEGDAPSAEHDALLRDAEQDAARLRQARGYAAIATHDDGLDDAALRRAMARQAMALLDELLAQREPAA